MKNLIFMIVAVVIATGCTEDDDCYRYGTTKERCESNPKCQFRGNDFGIIYADGQYTTIGQIMKGWGHNYMFVSDYGTCMDKSIIYEKDDPPCGTGVEDPCPPRNTYCLMYAEHIFLRKEAKSPPSLEWIDCELLGLKFDGTDFPVCGNGIIEPGEQCDGEQLGTMSDCAEHGGLLGKGPWTAGTISCSLECKWDYTGCQ